MKKVLTLGLALATSASFADYYERSSSLPKKEQKVSFNPSDWKTNTIPGEIAKFFASRFNAIQIDGLAQDMIKDGVEEQVFLGKITAEGGVFHSQKDQWGFDDVVEEGEITWVPFKISTSSDGSYSVQYALFKARDNEFRSYSRLEGWISVDNIEILSKSVENDESRGLEMEKIVPIDVDLRIGLYQTEDRKHNFYLKPGYTNYNEIKGGMDAEDGYRYDFKGSGDDLRISAAYTYGETQSSRFDIEAGYERGMYEGVATTPFDRFNMSAQTDAFNASLAEHELNLADYNAAKAEFEQQHNFPTGSLSHESYANLTGNHLPVFNQEAPELERSEVDRTRNTVFGKMSYSKYLPDRNIRLGFSLDAKYNLDDVMEGLNTQQTMGDKYNVGAKFRVEF